MGSTRNTNAFHHNTLTMETKELTIESHLLPPEAIEWYDRTGWYISDLVLEESLLDECIDAAERIYQGEYDQVQPWSTSPLLPNFGRPYAERNQLRVDHFPSFHSDIIRKVTHSPAIAAQAAQLLKTDEVRYYKDILIGTPTEEYIEGSAIGWHLDKSYWPTCVPEQMITVYVPLQDRDETNGTLVMVSGSHKWVNQSFNLTADYHDFEKIREKYRRLGYEVQQHPLRHVRGQVSFHSSLVIHATYPNTTAEFQHTIVFGLQGKSNRFIPSPLRRFNKGMVVNVNDEIGPRLSDGTPDIRDNDFYPVLFTL
jgi:hypothetical protein